MGIPVFKGTGVAIITPMNSKGVDYSDFADLINYLMCAEIEALIVCGTTGEGGLLEECDRKEITRFAVGKVKNSAKIIVGTGGLTTKKAVEQARNAQLCGADGILALTPYYCKASGEGIIRHFEAIAKAVDLPVIVYDVPGRTGVELTPEIFSSLAKIENIVAVKDASGSISHTAMIKNSCDLDIYSGCDELNLPILSLGGIGSISVTANILPRAVKKVADLFFSGKVLEAADEQNRLYAINKALFCEVNPIPVKAAAEMLGFCSGTLLPPLTKLCRDKKERLFKILANYLPL